MEDMQEGVCVCVRACVYVCAWRGDGINSRRTVCVCVHAPCPWWHCLPFHSRLYYLNKLKRMWFGVLLQGRLWHYVFLPPCTRTGSQSGARDSELLLFSDALVQVAASLKCNVWFVYLLLSLPSFLHLPELSRIICFIYELKGWRLVLVK